MLQIEERSAPPPSFALFELGFRPFFSAAGLFAVLSIAAWMAIYVFSASWIPPEPGGMLWHGHEMVFGYAMAVVAGFLLTAVGNWTGIPGLRGTLLAGLLVAWGTARVALILPMASAPVIAAAADGVFMLGLIVAVTRPVVQVRQWKQLGIITKLLLLLLCNAAYYAGVLGYLDNGGAWGLYAGLYLILALVFAMARRVVPFFIERGVGETFQARNRAWVDIGSMVLFLAWAVIDVFFPQQSLVGWLSVVLFGIHVVRMRDWYTPGIWKAPLLWSLYLGYGSLVLGFLLKALSVWWSVAPTLALHAFAVGGVGLITLGMMSRVSLGHTGRSVLEPPSALTPMFTLLALAALVRVFAPIVDAAGYVVWIGISQSLWMGAFGLFCVVYLPILARPRAHGAPG